MAAGRLATGYLFAVNAGSAGLFWYDKKCAELKQWRVPEATLCASAAVGGWIGGSWAMTKFRHKTAKKSFKDKYNAAVATNLAGGGALAVSPALRQRILRSQEQLELITILEAVRRANHISAKCRT